MRSLKYFSAVLPLHFLAASAAKNDADTTVIETITRTVTICPIVDLFQCAETAEPARPWMDWIDTTNTPRPTSASTTTSKNSSATTTSTGKGDDGTSSTRSGTSTATGTYTGSVTSTSTGTGSTTSGTVSGTTGTGSTTTGTGSTTTGTGSTTTGTGSTTTGTGSTTTGTDTTTTGTGTTTTGTITTTTGISNGTTTSTTSGTTTITTTTGAGNATCPTASPGYNCPGPRPGDECNKAGSRNLWCHGKTVDSDTHNEFSSGETKRFKLVLTSGFTNADGAGSRPVYFINGKTPGEAIEVNWGDMVEIEVQNLITDNVTSIHWHGVRQVGTNDQDGVPGVTECGIAPGSTRKYTWHASSYGTGWYHSHALAQYGGGLRGPLIIHGPATADYDVDMGHVMVDEKLEQGVFELAARIAKTQGQLPAASNVLFNGANRSPDDTTGVAQKWVVQSGKKYLFRIINSSAQSAYALRIDGHKLKVISADFVSIKPYDTEWLYVSSGQRYNVIVEANQPAGAYYMRAVTQLGCGGRSVNDGKGNANAIIEYATSLGVVPFSGGNLTSFNTQTDCRDEPIASLVPHVAKNGGNTADFTNKVKLLAGGNAALEQFGAPHGQAVRWYLGPPTDIALNSNTTRSNKGINVTFEQPTLKTFATVPNLNYSSPVFSNAVVLDSQPNQWVYFVIQNNFQTAHPMHLHGHDFSVLGQGKGVFNVNTDTAALNFANPIRRDTANLFGMPVPNTTPPQYRSGWTVIGFETDNPGAWVMHCHIIWHADAGMGLQYLERPGEITATKYYGAEFKEQCSGVEAYHANGGAQKAPYEAGLKRHLSEHMHGHAHGHLLRDAPSY